MSVMKQARRARLAVFAVPLVALVAALAAFGWTHGQSPSAQAQVPVNGAMGLGASGGGAACEASGCTVPAGGEFTLSVSVSEVPDPSYIGVGTQIDYDGLVYHPTAEAADELVLPDCGFPGIGVRAPAAPVGNEGIVTHGQTAGLPPSFEACTYTGPVVEISLSCPADGEYTVSLIPYSEDNTLGSGFKVDLIATATIEAQSLTVNCGGAGPPAQQPTNTPTTGGPGPTGGGVVTPPTQGLPPTGDASGIDGDGDGNTLWIIIGSVLGSAALAALALFGWRRYVGAR
ncbi:MAG: hypothetical protein U1B78_07015 [Dehalococcoidia bacterium]|nr:hypothetical protein [Dehalococcoidia bacterium]